MTGTNLRDGRTFARHAVLEGVLHCPVCRGGWLHQVGVSIFERAEDDPRVLRVEIAHEPPAASAAWSGPADNPSARRNSITIYFRCESCGGGVPGRCVELTFSQHKGQTEITWRGPLIEAKGGRHDR